MYTNKAVRVLLAGVAVAATLSVTGCASSEGDGASGFSKGFPFADSTPEPEPSPTNSPYEPYYHGTFIQKMKDGTEYECIWASEGGESGGSLWCPDEPVKK